ncbi:MAG: ScpA family protein [Actinomycetota bacterium]
MATVVTTQDFEGPIDLLLQLVSSHDRDILEIELAPIVDRFLKVLVENRNAYSMDTLSEFLLIAAILIELKSQRLLPGPDEIDPEEEYLGWEERDVLLSRLLECRAYASVSDLMLSLMENTARTIPREVGVDEGFAVRPPDLLEDTTLEGLREAYLRATAERIEPTVDLFHVTIYAVTVAEVVQTLAKRLQEREVWSFRDIVDGVEERIEIIVHFLAVLELCKLGRVNLGQGRTFGELTVTWLSTPESGADLEVDDYDG